MGSNAAGFMVDTLMTQERRKKVMRSVIKENEVRRELNKLKSIMR